MPGLRRTLLNLSLGLSVLTLLAAVASGVGARLDLWGFATGFVVLRWSAYTAIGALALAVIVFLWTLVRRGQDGVRMLDPRYIVILIACSLVIGVPYSATLEFKKYPTVADATTNIDDPPAFKALIPIREKTAQNPLDYRGDEAARLQREHFPGLDSIRTSATPEAAIQAAERAASQMGLDIVEVDPARGRLEATDTTFWFGFKDDVVVRVRRPADGRTQVDIRSASRVGYLDGGLNARRVQRLRRLIQDRLTSAGG